MKSLEEYHNIRENLDKINCLGVADATFGEIVVEAIDIVINSFKYRPEMQVGKIITDSKAFIESDSYILDRDEAIALLNYIYILLDVAVEVL